jgi:peptidoglycan/xylan/chitin deacetylase (PgdA/CDA1 family)
MYHGLFDDPSELSGRPRAEARYWVSTRAFERQIEALLAEGYRTVPIEALLPGGPGLEVPRPIVITFDDGHASDHAHALPLLRRLGWRSEHFLTAGRVGARGFLDWAQVADLVRAGMGIHSHSLTHPDLDALAPDALERELRESKRLLEQHAGRPVEILALPGGSGATAAVTELARAAGYRGICTSAVGLNEPGAAPYALRRIPITADTTPAQLLAWARGAGLARLALTRGALRATRRVMGAGRYERLKEGLLRMRGAV